MSLFSASMTEVMQIAGVSFARLSKLTGIDDSNLRKYAKGDIDPRTETMENIAKACGFSPGIFYDLQRAKETTPGTRLIPLLDSATLLPWLNKKQHKRIDDVPVKVTMAPGSFGFSVDSAANHPELKEGDCAVIDVRVKPYPGALVVAHDGHKGYLRQFRAVKVVDSQVVEFELVPINSMFNSILSREVAVTVVGTMVEFRRPVGVPEAVSV